MKPKLVAATLIAIVLSGTVLTGWTFHRWTVSQLTARRLSVRLTSVSASVDSPGTYIAGVEFLNPGTVPIDILSALIIVRWDGRTIGASGLGGLDLTVPPDGKEGIAVEITSNLSPHLLPPDTIGDEDGRWTVSADLRFRVPTRHSTVPLVKTGAMIPSR